MTRAAATVVIRPVSDPRATTRCLDRLRPTLGVRDRIVLVAPAGAAAPHRLPPGVRCLAGGPGESTDELTARAAREASTPLVAELHADVLVLPHWLDRLDSALDDPQVRTAGPRTNLAPLGQGTVEALSVSADWPAVRDYARQWSDTHDAVTCSAEPLSDLCRLRRREDVDGPADARWDAVVESVYVHHLAEPGCPLREPLAEATDAPLVSASLIVKDEEELIAGCITAVRPFVDEVVVYDTGSTDRTREIAASLGATVVEGYWDDHFGAARNRSLEHCSGRWVLWVDADEVIEGDPAALRASLAQSDTHAFQVPIHNLSSGGIGSGSAHIAMRLFRRTRGAFSGRLHEQVVDRALGCGLEGREASYVRIVHSGYLPERIDAKDKKQRNLELSELAVRDSAPGGAGDLDWGAVAVNHARSVSLAGDRVKALELLGDAWNLDMSHCTRRQLCNSAFAAAVDVHDLDAAQLWLDRLEGAGGSGPSASYHRARLLSELDQLSDACALLDILSDGSADGTVDVDGAVFDMAVVASLHAWLLARTGREGEAVDVLLASVRRGVSDRHLASVLALLRSTGRPFADLVDALPSTLRVPFLAQCLQLVPTDGDEVLEAMWVRSPGPDVLAAAAVLAPALPVLRALEWAARLRVAGAAQDCPLCAIGADDTRSARDRVLASAIAVESFEDFRALALLESALAAVPDADAPAVLDELALVAPGIAAAVEPADG